MASDDDEGMFRLETVPPPEGESDVYNAPTRVGTLAGTIAEEIIQQARREAEQSGVDGALPGIDSTKLRALEELAARDKAALRPKAVPEASAIGLDGADQTSAVAADAHLPERASSEEPRPKDSSPVAAPTAVPDGGPTASPRPASRLTTILLLAVVLALLAFGIYRLRR